MVAQLHERSAHQSKHLLGVEFSEREHWSQVFGFERMRSRVVITAVATEQMRERCIAWVCAAECRPQFVASHKSMHNAILLAQANESNFMYEPAWSFLLKLPARAGNACSFSPNAVARDVKCEHVLLATHTAENRSLRRTMNTLRFDRHHWHSKMPRGLHWIQHRPDSLSLRRLEITFPYGNVPLLRAAAVRSVSLEAKVERSPPKFHALSDLGPSNCMQTGNEARPLHWLRKSERVKQLSSHG